MCSIAVSIRGGTFNLRRACRSFVWLTLSKTIFQSSRTKERFDPLRSEISIRRQAMEIA